MINESGLSPEGNSVTFFPLYNIYSDLVKVALGLTDNRSVERFFRDAGIRVQRIGKKKCVACEDLLNIMKGKKKVLRYKAPIIVSKEVDDLE
jgi:hypothetical protein